MNPTPERLQRLRDALVSAFPSHTELAQMMYYQFGINIETIAKGNLTEAVFDVIKWADGNNRLDELVKKARKANEWNQDLIAFEQDVQSSEVEKKDSIAEPPAAELDLQPSIGERLTGLTLKRTRVFLYKGHRILGGFFTLHPGKLFLYTSLAALFFLIVPAYLMKIGFMEHFSEKRGAVLKVGFLNLNRWNWWLMYTVVLPMLFGGTVWLSNYMRTVVAAFVHRRVQLIVGKDGKPATNFHKAFADKLASHSRLLLIVSFVVAAGIMIADTEDLFRNSYRYLTDMPYSFDDYDWTVAFLPGKFHPEPRWNTATPYLVFDVVAYSFQAMAAFLGVFWTFKFWLYLKVFSGFMDPSRSNYRFNPMVYDPKKRLGLFPMGRLFNGFILIMIGFQCYVFGHRLQQIHDVTPLLDYILQSLRIVNPIHLLDLDFLKDSFQLRSFDEGMVILLFFATLPILIVSYFPLLTLRRFIDQQKYRARLQHSREHDLAVKAGNAERAKILKAEMDLLDDACIWPNGDIAAKRFLVVMITLAVASVFPPLFIYGAIVFVLIELFRFFNRKR